MAFLFRCMENTDLEIRDRIDCAKAILPYQHRKMPVAVDLIAEVRNMVTVVRRIYE